MDREFTPEDFEKNKALAGLGYIVFFVPLITCKESKLGRYCANQGLILLILTLLERMLFSVLGGIPFLGWIFRLAGGLIALALFIVGLLCYIQLMTNDKVIELPYVGGFRLLP